MTPSARSTTLTSRLGQPHRWRRSALMLKRVLALKRVLQVGGGLLLSAAPIWAVDAADLHGWNFEGPDPHLDHGAVVLTQGVVLNDATRRIIADAARLDWPNDDLYATGRVVFTMPRIRIHAARLGLHPQARTGEAWDVDVFITVQGRTIRAKAKHARLEPTKLTLEHVEVDGGHGGIISFTASKLHVYLFAEPKRDRDGFEEYVSGIDLVTPTGRIADVPVLWLPYLYRDYYFTYPWTRVRVGHTKRQGDYIHYWIGTNLPAAGGWRTRIEGRVDDHSRAGFGGGANLFWEHQRYGTGLAEWYAMPREQVADAGTNDNDGLYAKRQQVMDLEHRLNLGAGAVSARYVTQPATDATSTLASPATPPSPDRFRSDYLLPDVERRPFARQSVVGVYSVPGVTLALDTQRRANPLLNQTERWLGAQAVAAPTQVIGPVHIGGEAWVEDLHRVVEGSRATRTTADAALSAGQWFGPVGFDGDAGLRTLAYAAGTNHGADQAAANRWLPFTDAGTSLRLAHHGAEYTHTFTPRLGVQVLGAGHGDVLPNYGFGDSRDILADDARYWTAGFTTNVAKTHSLFNGSATARFAMRQKEREYTSSDGDLRVGHGRLVDVTGSFQGAPFAALTLTTSFTWDARRREWTALDGSSVYVLNAHAALRYSATLIQPTATNAKHEWQHQPGVVLIADRYRFDGHVILIPGGAAVDTWSATVARRMVDGELFLSYEHVRDPSGAVQDNRVGIGFTLGSPDVMDPNAEPRFRGSSVNLR